MTTQVAEAEELPRSHTTALIPFHRSPWLSAKKKKNGKNRQKVKHTNLT